MNQRHPAASADDVIARKSKLPLPTSVMKGFSMPGRNSKILEVKADQPTAELLNPLFRVHAGILDPIAVEFERQRRRPRAKHIKSQFLARSTKFHRMVVIGENHPRPAQTLCAFAQSIGQPFDLEHELMSTPAGKA